MARLDKTDKKNLAAAITRGMSRDQLSLNEQVIIRQAMRIGKDAKANSEEMKAEIRKTMAKVFLAKVDEALDQYD